MAGRELCRCAPWAAAAGRRPHRPAIPSLPPPPQDIYTLFHLNRDFKFISKTSNFLIPIIGWSMFLTGARARCEIGPAARGTTSQRLLRCLQGISC